MLAAIVDWGVIAWVIAWIPYMAAVSIALFALVVTAYLYGIRAGITGIVNAMGKLPADLLEFALKRNPTNYGKDHLHRRGQHRIYAQSMQ